MAKQLVEVFKLAPLILVFVEEQSQEAAFQEEATQTLFKPLISFRSLKYHSRCSLSFRFVSQIQMRCSKSFLP